jgi:hypothetical protein
MNRYMFMLPSLILVDLDNINPDNYIQISLNLTKLKLETKGKIKFVYTQFPLRKLY